MKVKTSNSSKRISQEILDWFGSKRKSKWFYVLAIIGLLGLLACSHIYSIYYGATLQKEGKIHTIRRWGQTIAKKPFSIVSNYFEGLEASPNKMQLDIKFENYQKIAFQRDLALKYGPAYRNHPSNMGYVPARITYNGEESKVKIRLKGGQIEHFGHPYKWSFKMKMKGDGRVEGMKLFSVQQVKNRSYINEWILHRFLKYNDLIGLQYEFVDLTVNGKHHGIYALEENMAKQLLESNKLKEGPIINYNSEINWFGMVGAAYQLYGGEVHAYNDNFLENPALKKNFLTAKNLLERFRSGQLPTHKVFDSAKMARYFAIIDLTGYHHATSLKDMKLYYNPITSLIEPIGYDNGYFIPLPFPNQDLAGEHKRLFFSKNIDEIRTGGKTDWYNLLFSDEVFFETYIKELEKISDEKLLTSFFEEIEKDLKASIGIIRREHPWYNHDGVYENPQTLFKNQNYIRRILSPAKSMQAHYSGANENSLTLEAGNIISLPLEITGISLFNDSINVDLEQPVFLQSYNGDLVNYKKFEIQLPNSITWTDSLIGETKLKYRIIGASKILKESNIYPWPFASDDFAEQDFMTKEPNFSNFPFIEIDKESKSLFFKEKINKVSEDLIIPKGYTVKITPGSSIDLTNSASILTYSPIKFIGTIDKPIKVFSSDMTGQGIMILRAKDKSILKNVVFENLSNPNKSGWSITGAVTFYESDISIKSTSFINNIKGDDYLNIVRSSFDIEDSYFYKVNSDAFDGDFCTGTIKNTRFNLLGNDGIDVSGSKVNITNVQLDSVGDKALSAGEDSHLIANQIIIKNSELGVTSKDLSSVKITNIEMQNTKLPYVIFEKKPEFGPATITATKSKINGFEFPFLVEKNSTLFIEGQQQFSEESNNIKDLLYGVKFGKKSIR